MPKIEAFERGSVRGFFHQPDGRAIAALVLTHGAGSNAEAPLLIKTAHAFADAGLAVLRCDLEFRKKRPKGPPHPSQAADDRTGLKAAVQALIAAGHERVTLGGHSYGGRQASMLAADDWNLVSALLLLSYPLHPPSRPEQLRTAHFSRVQTPALFVSGTRDGFATPDELRTALAAIPAHTETIFVDRAGHDLLPKSLDIKACIVQPFLRLLKSIEL